MRHSVFGKKLSRTKNERRRLLQSLSREIIVHGSIRTTVAKAKAVQPLIEKLITSAKRGSKEVLKRTLSDWKVAKLLLSDAKTRFSGRSSGFTRIIKLGTRSGDNTEEVMLSFIDPHQTIEKVKHENKTNKPITR